MCENEIRAAPAAEQKSAKMTEKTSPAKKNHWMKNRLQRRAERRWMGAQTKKRPNPRKNLQRSRDLTMKNRP